MRLCWICGNKEFQRLLARVKRPEDQWLVCDECGFEMLHSPTVLGVWTEVREPALVQNAITALRGGQPVHCTLPV